MQDILSDLEKEAIGAFLANETMAEAVRKVLLVPVYANGVFEKGRAAEPTRNFALTLAMEMENNGMTGAISDEDLGRDLRASTKAIRMLELGFKQLKSYVPTPPVTEKPSKHNKGK